MASACSTVVDHLPHHSKVRGSSSVVSVAGTRGPSHKTIKLDHFINSNIYDIAVKRSSLQDRVSKFTPKRFYEINPRGQCYKTFFSVIYEFS
jgi:hypothetical protein